MLRHKLTYCVILENGKFIQQYDFYMPTKTYEKGETFENQNVRYEILKDDEDYTVVKEIK